MDLCCSCSVLVLFSMFAMSPGSDELKSIRIEAPTYVRLGDPLTMICQYDLDIRSVYSVKWYHNGEEFYRYLPKESPPQQVFPKDGILVNMTFSNDRQVVLTNTSRNTSGKFKCSVSAELTFKTLEDTLEVTVVVVGYDRPRLYVDQVEYSQSDTAKANCTIDQTWPPINITWFVNGVPVPDANVQTSLKPVFGDPSLTSTVSRLSFKVPDNYTLIRLKCTGTLFDVYDISSEMTISLKRSQVQILGTNLDSIGQINASNDSAQAFQQPAWFICVLTKLALCYTNHLYLN